MSNILYSPYRLGRIELKNRLVMAPMTRSRSSDNVPGDMVAAYYAQRAEAGLIVTEGTSPSPNGLGYPRMPGMYSPAQAAGWTKVTDAVHRNGGRIFVQLMHSGRVGHPANLPTMARLVGPSAVPAPGQMFTDSAGLQDHPVPHALTETEIEQTIEEYVHSAKLAIESGFDGVELHGANGYLIDQFLNVASNQRTDGWGGSVDNRIRFATEVAHRTAEAIGADRVGLRVSPYGVFNGMTPDAELDTLYLELAQRLSALRLVYLHTVDHSSMGAPTPPPELIVKLRVAFAGAFILSGGYDARRAESDLRENRGDLVAFGRQFLANPKLVTKFKTGAPLNVPDPSTFYTPGAKGYDDYV